MDGALVSGWKTRSLRDPPLGRFHRWLRFRGMGSACFRVAARYLSSTDLRWAGMESGRGIPPAGRRTDRDPDGDSIPNAYPPADSDCHSHRYRDAYSYTNQNSNFYTNAISDAYTLTSCSAEP